MFNFVKQIYVKMLKFTKKYNFCCCKFLGPDYDRKKVAKSWEPDQNYLHLDPLHWLLDTYSFPCNPNK